MKGAWRAAALLFLPGMAAGGLLFEALFHLLNLSDDLLGLLAAGGVLWTAAAAAAAGVMSKLSGAGARYYSGVGGFLSLLALGGFLADHLHWSMLHDALWELPLSGAGIGVMLSALLGSGSFSSRDRACWGIGAAGFAAAVAAFRFSRLGHFHPAFHCWITVLTIFCFLAASPLTRRGPRSSRLSWAALLTAALALRMAAVPFYLPLPDGLTAKEASGERVWDNTKMSVNGVRFCWLDRNGRRGFYTPYDRLITRQGEDEEYRSAIPGALGALERSAPEVLVIGGPGSVWPALLRQTELCQSLYFIVIPNDLRFVPPGPYPVSAPRRPPADALHGMDVIALLTLPPRQYPDRISLFLDRLEQQLEEDGILLVPEVLLRQPHLARELENRFPYHGLLPGPGRMRLFSRRYRDLSVKHIDRELDRLYGEDAPLPFGTYSLLFAETGKNRTRQKEFSAETLTLGADTFLRDRHAPWPVWCGALALLLLWRLVRLPLERRGGSYRLWNSAENGFAWFWLLALVCVINLAVFATATEYLLYLAGAGALIAVNIFCGGTLTALLLTGILTWKAWNGDGTNILFWSILATVQGALLAGRLLCRTAETGRERRRHLAMWFLGGFGAVLLMAAALALHAPVLLLGLIGMAVRLPAMWQKGVPHAILSKTKG